MEIKLHRILINLNRVVIAFDSDKSYIGSSASENLRVKCAPNYFTDLNELICQNEEKIFPYLQTDENKNMITMTCYELYSMYMSEVANIIDPNYKNTIKVNRNIPTIPTYITSTDVVNETEPLSKIYEDNFNHSPREKMNQCILAVPPYFNKNHVMNIKSLFDKFSDSCIIINI